MRFFGTAIAMLMGIVGAAQRCCGADTWGGSLGLTSDYLVRGISRSSDHAALQTDVHYLNTSGFLAGVSASTSHIDPGERSDAELSAFVGFAWNPGNDWRGKLLATHYSYPWNSAGSRYDYDELDLDIGYRDWLSAEFEYSPHAPYLWQGYVLNGSAESAEVNLQRPLLGKLTGTAGVGYYYLNSPAATGYAYWSAGLAYDLAPWSLSVAYVRTTSAANSLFYNAAVDGRWMGTVIWRFK